MAQPPVEPKKQPPDLTANILAVFVISGFCSVNICDQARLIFILITVFRWSVFWRIPDGCAIALARPFTGINPGTFIGVPGRAAALLRGLTLRSCFMCCSVEDIKTSACHGGRRPFASVHSGKCSHVFSACIIQ